MQLQGALLGRRGLGRADLKLCQEMGEMTVQR